MAVWRNLYHKENKLFHCREENVTNACKSTLRFLEGDCVDRKFDFFMKTYALTYDMDRYVVEALVDGLEQTYP